jgi:CDP-diacylglycerol--glycerol-3-phosphate 3-phosphatidyltransferase
MLLTPLFLYCYSRPSLQWQLGGVAIFVLASLTDWYDGYIARKYGVITRLGQFLDPLADKILVLSGFYLFVYMGILNFWLVTVIAFRDIFVTVLRIYALFVGMPIITHLVAKWKTFIQMVFQFIILFTFPFMKSHPNLQPYLELYQIWANWILLGIAILTAWSMIIYIKENWQLITKFMKYMIRT